MPLAGVVLAALLRETCRALLFPLRLLLYLPRSRRWRAAAREALQAPPVDATDTLAGFLRNHPHRPGLPHVLISAGEASGELHAGNLMRAAAAQGLAARWTCFGGARLQQAGGELRFPLAEHAVMGVLGVLRELPRLVRAFVAFACVLRDDPPGLVVLVDYPGLHLVFGAHARRAGIPVLHYVAPQYWAWAPWRMRRYRRCVDATLAILPFEPAFFRPFGIPAAYVGHPLLDEIARAPAPAAPAARRLVLLPGSRTAEVRAHLPAMLDLAHGLLQRDGTAEVVVAHADPRRAALIEAMLAQAPDPRIRFTGGPIAAALRGARAALAKSGTGSLESCLLQVPTVVVYSLPGALWRFLHRHFLTVPHFASANLIAGREIVPERLVGGLPAWQAAGAELWQLWQDSPRRAQCVADLDLLRRHLGEPGASARAAAWVVQFFQRGPAATVQHQAPESSGSHPPV
jgi:lipid-A-disaccharide synthase